MKRFARHSKRIIEQFRECGRFARKAGLRTTFHPDQFVVLHSPKPDVVASSIQEIEYQAEVARWIGADVINIHAGGAYGDAAAALERFAESLARLSKAAGKRLASVLVVSCAGCGISSDILGETCRILGIPAQLA